MSKYLFAFIIMLSQFVNCFSQEFGVLKDPRDGRVYKTVKIGEQVWMAGNLNVSTFRNGDPIPQAKTYEEWKKAGDNKQPAWGYYENDPANGAKYGKLYNWYAVNDPRGLAPLGYHIPSDAEWTLLTDYLGGAEIAGYKMKSKQGWLLHQEWRGGGWAKESNGTNSSGFSGLPGGYRTTYGSFSVIGEDGYWWSSTEYGYFNAAWHRTMSYRYHEFYKLYGGMEEGYSVRCIRD